MGAIHPDKVWHEKSGAHGTETIFTGSSEKRVGRGQQRGRRKGRRDRAAEAKTGHSESGGSWEGRGLAWEGGPH